MRRAISAVVLALTLGLAACSAATSSTTPNMTVHGTETVSVGILDGTSAQDAYPDVTDGGQVTVYDSAEHVIANGTLSEQSSTDLTEQFSFTVTVPEGLPRYGIQIGSSSHGTVWFTAAQMKRGPGICLGDGC